MQFCIVVWQVHGVRGRRTALSRRNESVAGGNEIFSVTDLCGDVENVERARLCPTFSRVQRGESCMYVYHVCMLIVCATWCCRRQIRSCTHLYQAKQVENSSPMAWLGREARLPSATKNTSLIPTHLDVQSWRHSLLTLRALTLFYLFPERQPARSYLQNCRMTRVQYPSRSKSLLYRRLKTETTAPKRPPRLQMSATWV